MKKMSDPNREKNYYFAEQPVPYGLEDDVVEPSYGVELMTKAAVYYWDGIGTKSLAHQDDAENFMCVIRGWKEFYIVSPFESAFVYPGLKDGMPPNYSPLAFDNLDTKTYPRSKDA